MGSAQAVVHPRQAVPPGFIAGWGLDLDLTTLAFLLPLL